MPKKSTARTRVPRAEFAKLTQFCAASDNREDNTNRAAVLGHEPGVNLTPGACVQLSGAGRIGPRGFVGLRSLVQGEVILENHIATGPLCCLCTTQPVFDPATQSFRPGGPMRIVVGEGTWLAAACVVMPGVRIGRHNLICANAVVTRSTRDYAIMAGTPARQIGAIDPKTGAYRWFGRVQALLDEAAPPAWHRQMEPNA
ncbi:MAG: acyltransferase [Kiritimatiellae bacterium]|nr:acyltransferase [Kiritimatiellia bacterium]